MTLNHEQAEAAGVILTGKWAGLTGHDAPEYCELKWADIVQSVLHIAREMVAEMERAGG